MLIKNTKTEPERKKLFAGSVESPFMSKSNPIDTLIVIPCYNYGRFVAEAIESALGQTLKCKVAVVDDGSTDDTAEVVARYPEVIYFHKDNTRLPATARNYGIRRVDSEFILPLDADDILFPKYAETARDFLKNNPDYDIVTANGYKFGAEEGFISSSVLSSDIRVMNTMVYCSMYRRTLFDKVGGYHEDLPSPGVEDWAMWVKAYMLGAKAHLLPEPMWRYRIHPDSITFKELMPKLPALQNWMQKQGYTL